MKKLMERLKAIETRKAEIRTILSGEGAADLDALETELRDLDTEQKGILSDVETRERRTRLLGGIETRGIDTFDTTGGNAEHRTIEEKISTPEYRSAWGKNLLGVALTNEERTILDEPNAEYREFTHTTENSAVLIPKNVVAGIWKRAADEHPLYEAVKKLKVKGNLMLIKGTGNKAGAPTWYDESTTLTDGEEGLGSINLTGCELAKIVKVSWKLKAMAVEDFIAYIEQEIAEQIGAALAYGVANGKGKPATGETFKEEPLGIKTALVAETDTPQVVEYATNVEYKTLTAAMAKIHSSYAAGAEVYASSETIWNDLANIVDAQKRPIFIPDVTGQEIGRIFGRPVKAESSIASGEILIGNADKGYLLNTNQDMTIHVDDKPSLRRTDYVGYAIVDGEPVDNKAFAYIRKTPAGA